MQPLTTAGDVMRGLEEAAQCTMMLLPWMPLASILVPIGLWQTALANGLWLAFFAFSLITWMPVAPWLGCLIIALAGGATAVALSFSYRATRLQKQVWYLEQGSSAAKARRAMAVQALHAPRTGQVLQEPLTKVPTQPNSLWNNALVRLLTVLCSPRGDGADLGDLDSAALTNYITQCAEAV